MAAVRKDWLKTSAHHVPKVVVKPSWMNSESSKPAVVDKGFRIDKERRYQGTVTSFHRSEGFGFIRSSNLEVQGGVYVDVSAIQTVDRFPALESDMQVEFGLMKWKERSVYTLRATSVTLPGGAMVVLQDKEDMERDFLGGAAARFAGKLKHFIPQSGFGAIAVEENIALDPELGLPHEVRVEVTEVNCGSRRPKWRLENLEVEFGIFRGDKGQFLAHNMTLPEGKPITEELLLKRQVETEQLFLGVITFWHFTEHWGLITIDDGCVIPERIKAVMEMMERKATEKRAPRTVYFALDDLAEDFCPEERMRVYFNLYTDTTQSAGATNIIPDSSDMPEAE